MALEARRWAIVLGAGDGTRLHSLTRRMGVPVPKQYCSLDGEQSLFQLALRRAERVVSPACIVTVVAEGHRDWWQQDLRELPPRNVVVQPANRGTAAGVLLPLLEVMRRDPEARVALFPSDHWVEAEWVLADAVGSVFELLELDPRRVILLGISPDEAEPGYGWIVPGACRAAAANTSVSAVTSFVEKPDPESARLLMLAGGLWNSFIMAGSATALVQLYARRLPGLLAAMRAASLIGSPRAMAELYEVLEPRDFSRDLLQGGESDLLVAQVPSCGWTDLGTPLRVAACVRRAALRGTTPDADRVNLACAFN
jgi:mannose-1-phosphate guanylyltransferase